MTQMTLAAQSLSPFVHEDRIAEWLVSRSAPSEGKQRCILFVLFHSTTEGSEAITTRAIEPKASDDERIQRLRDIAHEFHENALTTAATFPGPQRFSVSGYRTTKPDGYPVGQFPFLLSSKQELTEGFAESEAPNHIGLTAQAMRHSEALMRTFVTGLTDAHERLMNQLDMQYRRSAHLEEMNTRIIIERERLLDGQALRGLEVQKRMLSMQRNERLMQQLESFLPLIVAKWAGVSPNGSPVPVKKFLASLTPEQWSPFVASLSEEQKSDFATILQSVTVEANAAALAEAGKGEPAS